MLRVGVGYALAEDKLGAARLRDKYAAKMAEGPDGRAFDVVTGGLGSSSPEFREVARLVAAGDTLSGFLRDLKARYPEMQGVLPERGGARRQRAEGEGRSRTDRLDQAEGTAAGLGALIACATRRRSSAPGARDQAPAVHQHEEDQLERQRHHHRRQHHHAHRHQHRRHHEVDDQERQEQQEADLEGALQFRDHEGRNENAQRHLLGRRRHRLLGEIVEQLQVLVADVLEHELLERPGRALERLLGGDLVGDHRLDADVIGALERRPHHEGGEEQRQRHDHGIGRRGRGAERGAQQRQHHHDPRERGHHHQDRRRERQHRQQRDQLDHALGEAGALAEIDADVLGVRGMWTVEALSPPPS